MGRPGKPPHGLKQLLFHPDTLISKGDSPFGAAVGEEGVAAHEGAVVVKADVKAAPLRPPGNGTADLSVGVCGQLAVAVDEPEDIGGGSLSGEVHLVGSPLGAGQNPVAGADFFHGIIGAAAVGKEDFPVPRQGIQLGKHGLNGLALIINGENHGDFHARKSFLT